MSEDCRFYLIAPLAYTGKGGLFTYHADEALEPGQIVEVPIGRRSSLGVVLRAEKRPAFATKPIIRALDLAPLPAYLLNLASWMSGYYATSPSAVWSTFLPTGLTKNRRQSKVAPAAAPGGLPVDPLTREQTSALAAI